MKGRSPLSAAWPNVDVETDLTDDVAHTSGGVSFAATNLSRRCSFPPFPVLFVIPVEEGLGPRRGADERMNNRRRNRGPP